MDQKLLVQYLRRKKFTNGGIGAASGYADELMREDPLLRIMPNVTGSPILPGLGGAGIALALSKKDKDKPVTTETEEPKPPEQKPPEDKGSDIVTEAIATEAALRTGDKIKDKLSDEERDFLSDAIAYGKNLPEQIENKVKNFVNNKKTTFTENQFNKLIDALNSYHKGNIYVTQDASESPHTNYEDLMEWVDMYEGSPYEDGFLRKKNEYENLLVKIRKVTNLSKGKTWKPEKLEFKDITEQTDKLIKKAMGGLIDKPLTGRSRDI